MQAAVLTACLSWMGVAFMTLKGGEVCLNSNSRNCVCEGTAVSPYCFGAEVGCDIELGTKVSDLLPDKTSSCSHNADWPRSELGELLSSPTKYPESALTAVIESGRLISRAEKAHFLSNVSCMT